MSESLFRFFSSDGGKQKNTHTKKKKNEHPRAQAQTLDDTNRTRINKASIQLTQNAVKPASKNTLGTKLRQNALRRKKLERRDKRIHTGLA